VLGTIYLLIAGGGSAQASILTVLLPGCVGYYAPKYWVQRRLQVRQEQIIQGFPDTLDLMLVCVEAGQSLDQAINRVAKEIETSYPSLAEEFQIVAYEMKAGKEKSRVLRDMGERVDVQDINSFVTTLIQSRLRHLDRRGAAGLCRRDARQARDAGRGKGQQASHEADARHDDVLCSAASDHPDRPVGLRHRNDARRLRGGDRHGRNGLRLLQRITWRDGRTNRPRRSSKA
jgi:hypothetical protein